MGHSLYKLPTKSQKKIALENMSSNVHHRNPQSQKERNYLHKVKVGNVILLLVVPTLYIYGFSIIHPSITSGLVLDLLS